MNPEMEDPPDLLRRFVETPFQRSTVIQSVEVILRTNDARLASMFPVAPPGNGGGYVLCTVIADPDVPASSARQVIDDGHIRTVILEQGAQLHFDAELRSISGFFAPASRAAVEHELLKGIESLWAHPQ